MVPYSDVAVLFWLAQSDDKGILHYHLEFKDEKQEVDAIAFCNCILNASDLCYPIICIN